MKPIVGLLFLLFSCASSSLSQTGSGYQVLAQALLDLQHEGVVMHIAAHPDDEDGSALAYLRKKVGAKAYSVFLTRGEGGQNEIGSDLYESLGAIRTAETKAAARIQGSIPIFLNFLDFGYSKSATETFAVWGGQTEVLRRLIYTIRKLKPDILFTNFNTINGHGHHQVAGICAIAAFDGAADSMMFPEQLRMPGVTLWQPRKLFVREFSASTTTFDASIPITEKNDRWSRSYLEIAAEALAEHKSQGMDRADLARFTRGISRYRLARANSVYGRDTTSFFGGIDLWSGNTKPSVRALKELIGSLRIGMPADSLLQIVSNAQQAIRVGLQDLTPFESRVIQEWDEELISLAMAACGIVIHDEKSDSIAVRNQEIELSLQVSSSGCSLSDVKVRITAPNGWAVNENRSAAPVLDRHVFRKEYLVRVGGNASFTVPAYRYQYHPIGWSQELLSYVSLRANGYPIELRSSIKIDIAPVQLMEVAREVVRVSPRSPSKSVRIEAALVNYLPQAMEGSVTATVPEGWKSSIERFSIPSEDGSTTVPVTIVPPASLPEGQYLVTLKSEHSSHSILFRSNDVVVADGIEVGVVSSYDNTIETVLKDLNVPYQLLHEKFLENLDLLQFTSIIIDIRAYLVRPDLLRNNQRLLDYVRKGGNLVVMYQKTQEWKSDYAPIPFELSRERITQEEAPVKVLIPHHPLMSNPNPITDDAWTGWVQERGVYFPAEVPSEYVKLLSSNDADEPPLTTGYIVASYGKGSYIYSSYVWYRQMKEMHPGALRSFANMISYPRFRY